VREVHHISEILAHTCLSGKILQAAWGALPPTKFDQIREAGETEGALAGSPDRHHGRVEKLQADRALEGSMAFPHAVSNHLHHRVVSVSTRTHTHTHAHTQCAYTERQTAFRCRYSNTSIRYVCVVCEQLGYITGDHSAGMHAFSASVRPQHRVTALCRMCRSPKACIRA
jgi:hypothetical protein